MIQFHPDICHQQTHITLTESCYAKERRSNMYCQIGNCFFRSVAVYVHGDEDYHNIVRKALCFHNSMTHHLKQMVKPCTRETQVELQAAANFYGTNLYVLTEKPNKTDYNWICYAASTNPSNKENLCKILLLICNWHIALLSILMS